MRPNLGFAYHCCQSTITNHVINQQETYTVPLIYLQQHKYWTNQPPNDECDVPIWSPLNVLLIRLPKVHNLRRQSSTTLLSVLLHHNGSRTRTAHVVVLCISTHVCRSWVPVIQSRVCSILQDFELGGTPTALEPSVTLSSRLPARKQTSSSIFGVDIQELQ